MNQESQKRAHEMFENLRTSVHNILAENTRLEAVLAERVRELVDARLEVRELKERIEDLERATASLASSGPSSGCSWVHT